MKRIFDVIMSFSLIVILLPLMLLLAMLLLILQGRPVVFRQQRPGQHARPFQLYKFRTMTNETDVSGNLMDDSVRITRFGRYMRQLGLDELPLLFNILKGDLSFVGPRPLLMEYLSLYSKEQMRRHEVRPGLTGWAQIHGRNVTSWDERFAHDIWYVDNHSFWLDMKIMVLTVFRIIRPGGIAKKEQVTMDKFTDTKS